MKTCNSCGRPFDEYDPVPISPAEIVGDLFHKSANAVDASDLCPACKEERGMLTLMGFGEWCSFSGKHNQTQSPLQSYRIAGKGRKWGAFHAWKRGDGLSDLIDAGKLWKKTNKI